MQDVRRKVRAPVGQQVCQPTHQPMHGEEHLCVQPTGTATLTGSQLLLRRGLLLVGVFSVLLMGILVRVYIKIKW